MNRIYLTFRRRNQLLLVCAALCLVIYDICGGLWLKGVTSAWFVALGAVNLCYERKQTGRFFRSSLVLWLGLLLGMCADVLLGITFYAGVAAFALGHVCYLIAFCLLEKPAWRDLLLTLPIAAVTIFLITGTPFIRIGDPFLRKLLIGYSVIIAGMLGKAAANVMACSTPFRKLILVGAILFWFSDLVLAVDMFGTSSRLTWILCSYTYWPAQNLLAHSLFHHTNEQIA